MGEKRKTLLNSHGKRGLLGGGILLFLLAGAIASTLIELVFGQVNSVLAFIVAQIVALVAFRVIISGLNREEVLEERPPGIKESRVRQTQAGFAIFLFIAGGALVDFILDLFIPGFPRVLRFMIAQLIGFLAVHMLFLGFGINRRFPVVE